VFLILVARAVAPVWEATRTDTGKIATLAKKRAFVTTTRFTSGTPRGTSDDQDVRSPAVRGRRSSSTATSTWPAPHKRRESRSESRATATPASPTPAAWRRSRTPCRSPRRQGDLPRFATGGSRPPACASGSTSMSRRAPRIPLRLLGLSGRVQPQPAVPGRAQMEPVFDRVVDTAPAPGSTCPSCAPCSAPSNARLQRHR
jgi:hypothetical protein